jgi:pilus assembly protein FimV
MARVHKLLLTLASSSALYSGVVSALGLGSITLHSALNQPLEAEIQLLEAGGLSADDVRVRLASEADFARSGVERIFFLNDLRFTPLFKGNRSVIRVTSSKAIREPYLNFVIELARPGGLILREYTLLIDPPSSSAYRSVAELPSYAQPQAVKARPPKRVTTVPVVIQGNSYQVLPGDNLWLIAKRLMASHPQRSQQALMDDILALNPQAFIGGDSSRLRAGVTLVLPDRAALPVAGASPSAAMPASEAVPAASLKELPGELPVNVTSPVRGSEASPSTAGSNAELALVQNRLDVELAARAEENRQLQTAMQALQAQLSALQEQMQAKDQQLELVRADLALNREQALSASSVAPLATASPAEVTPIEGQGSLLLWLLGASSVFLGGLATFFWWGRGRPPQEPEKQFDRPPVTADVLIKHSPLPLAVEPAAVLRAPAIAEPAPVRPIVQATSSSPAMVAPRNTSANADALEGANIYIAYGRFSEALGVLRKGLQAEPQRLELRLRMLEVLGELGDGAGFAQEEAILRQQGADSTQLDQLWARFAHLLVAEPEVFLDDSAVLLDEQPLLAPEPEPSPLLQDDFQLNLEDLSLDADWDLVSPFKTATSTRSKTSVLAAVANDPAFRSDLQHLPEVSEVQLEQNASSPFADWTPTPAAPEPLIDEEFVDAFAGESLKAVSKPALASLEHLATNRENLVKLNKALAYIAQGNLPSACSILNEVISDGDAQQQQEARELLAKIA